MTINGFSAFLSKIDMCKWKQPITNLAGSCVAIDMPSILFACRYGATCTVVDETNLMDSEPDMNRIDSLCIQLVLKKLAVYQSNGLHIICVFDSPRHPLGQIVREKRNKTRTKTQQDLAQVRKEFDALQPLERISKLSQLAKAYKNNMIVSAQFMDKVYTLFKEMGIPAVKPEEVYVKGSTGDAEALCATLCMAGVCSAGVAKDADFHMYGGNHRIIDIIEQRQKDYDEEGTMTTKKEYILEMCSLQGILACLQGMCNREIPFDEFQKMCVQAGTDYNDGNKGQAFTTILNLKKKGKQPEPIDTFEEAYKVIRSSIQNIPFIQTKIDMNKFSTNGKQILQEYSCDYLYPQFVKHVQNTASNN